MVPAVIRITQNKIPAIFVSGIFDWTGPFANTQDAAGLQSLFVSPVDRARITSAKDRSS